MEELRIVGELVATIGFPCAVAIYVLMQAAVQRQSYEKLTDRVIDAQERNTLAWRDAAASLSLHDQHACHVEEGVGEIHEGIEVLRRGQTDINGNIKALIANLEELIDRINRLGETKARDNHA